MSSNFMGAFHGYKSHQFHSRNQVFWRALRRLNRQGIQERGRKLAIPGLTVESNVTKGGHRGVCGA